MAPRSGRRGGGQGSSPQAIRELGVVGRKTGVSLPDRGQRDEHGMQPLEDIFSSPQKSRGAADDSGSEDMDIASSAGPGPQTLLKGRRNAPLSIPKSRSPFKTNLKSPARRNPNLEYLSSPARRRTAEDRDVTVTRKLDFAGGASASRPVAARGKAAKTNGNAFDEDDEDDDEEEDDLNPVGGGDDDEDLDMLEQSLQMVDDMASIPEDEPLFDDDVDEEEEARPVRPPPPRRGRPPKKQQEVQTARGSKKRPSFRDSAEMNDIQEEEEGYEEETEPEEELRSPKRQRTTGPAATKQQAAKASKAKPPPTKARGRPKGSGGRKPKAAASVGEEGEASFMALQRGPPMPKSRGLVSVRRDADSVLQTRSGRHSFRPLDYWRGEQVVPDEVEVEEYDFVLPTMKEVIRVPEEEATAKRTHRGRGRPKTQSKAQQAVDDEVEREEWELNPGVISTEVVLWEPEHELHPPAEDEPVHVVEEQVALSADAVLTKDIRDSTFRFAKTLTMPFMGAGVVDLPPGAEKRPKNSRKMHMVFFVHTGKVLVTVNEAQFRINAGGMWFVPRGNYYSVTNDYDNDARVFFAQACEVQAQPPEFEEE